MANDHIREATKKIRLIDANALIEHLTRCIDAEKGLFRAVCVAIKCFVEQMPTVDAVEVVHGRWIHVPSSDMMTGKAYKCSECNKMRYGSFMPNYCQICGAKMDGDGNGC